jgi:hypothetical protein
LQQLDEHTAFRRQLERHDMATLTTIGAHRPGDLVTLKTRYLDAYVPVTPARLRERRRAEWLARVMVHVEAHKRMVPIPVPER